MLRFAFAETVIGIVSLAMMTQYFNLGAGPPVLPNFVGDVATAFFASLCVLPLIMYVRNMKTPIASIVTGVLMVLVLAVPFWPPSERLGAENNFYPLQPLVAAVLEFVAYGIGRAIGHFEGDGPNVPWFAPATPSTAPGPEADPPWPADEA